jgi:hypothetical protein
MNIFVCNDEEAKMAWLHNHDYFCRARVMITELVREGSELDARPGHVEAKGFACEHSDILQEVVP